MRFIAHLVPGSCRCPQTDGRAWARPSPGSPAGRIPMTRKAPRLHATPQALARAVVRTRPHLGPERIKVFEEAAEAGRKARDLARTFPQGEVRALRNRTCRPGGRLPLSHQRPGLPPADAHRVTGAIVPRKRVRKRTAWHPSSGRAAWPGAEPAGDPAPPVASGAAGAGLVALAPPPPVGGTRLPLPPPATPTSQLTTVVQNLDLPGCPLCTRHGHHGLGHR